MAARYCPQCGQEVSATARFCANCAAPLTPEPVNQTSGIAPASHEGIATVNQGIINQGVTTKSVTQMDMAAQGTRRLLLPLMIAALIVLAIAVAVMAGQKHREALLAAQTTQAVAAPPLLNAPAVPGTGAPPLINAPSGATVAPPLTNAPSQPSTPAPALTNAPSAPAPELPPDVADYLKFLQAIEERRVALGNDANGAMAMMQSARSMQSDQGDPDQHNAAVPNNVSKISSGYGDYSTKWQMLAHDFRAKTPPDPCSLLANQYWIFLSGYTSVISKLQVALLNGDLSAAMGAQSAQQQINSDALKADDELSKVYARYSVPKAFSIKPDGATSSLVGGL